MNGMSSPEQVHRCQRVQRREHDPDMVTQGPHIQGKSHGGFISARYRTGTTTAWRVPCTLLMQMLDRAPVLVVANSPTAETLIRELRQLTRIAVAIESCECLRSK